MPPAPEELISSRSRREGIKALAQRIINSQSRQIAQMRQWYGSSGRCAMLLAADQHDAERLCSQGGSVRLRSVHRAAGGLIAPRQSAINMQTVLTFSPHEGLACHRISAFDAKLAADPGLRFIAVDICKHALDQHDRRFLLKRYRRRKEISLPISIFADDPEGDCPILVSLIGFTS